MTTNAILWVALVVYAVVMFALSPRAKTFGEFFKAERGDGRSISLGFLIGSVVISWLFAKSITNSANLSAKYGLVGGVAYAGWYLSIPVVGWIAYRLRTRLGVGSLTEFVRGRYGRLATFGFMVAILIRLFNEVWSNSAVVAAYFGEAETWPYYIAAIVFSLVTLGYSLRGGLRSSVLTDAFQCAVAAFLLVFIVALVVPDAGVSKVLASGSWTLAGGLDLLLVGLLQSLSYGFHDPVLTDRAFITEPRSMLGGYVASGVTAGAFIIIFGLVGVHAHLVPGVDAGQDAPLRVAEAFGVATLAGMSVLMMLSAGSTLDSTLSSFSKAVVQDLGGLDESGAPGRAPFEAVATALQRFEPIGLGRLVMVVTIVLGSLPLFLGAEILKATTISGTMVLGLAPAFLLWRLRAARALAFNLAFWPGVVIGISYAAGWRPEWLAIGEGSYGILLGVNLAATFVTFAGFAGGYAMDRTLGLRPATDGTPGSGPD